MTVANAENAPVPGPFLEWWDHLLGMAASRSAPFGPVYSSAPPPGGRGSAAGSHCGRASRTRQASFRFRRTIVRAGQWFESARFSIHVQVQPVGFLHLAACLGTNVGGSVSFMSMGMATAVPFASVDRNDSVVEVGRPILNGSGLGVY